ncbi:PHP domain-containing protein [Clostridium botulinum]|uniref:PHP domain protein n=1 Tax=Clostridium botulinum (strain Kyoto / Type A2) TaxID=536232 RepID=C1FTR8_CLOBJ|nr:PHP domain-containing protein [Clostridium botulinum]ACO85942.1 PHP domain protein [Clostridium botulinum A2 str. Kyoto]APH24538.1 PHP domain protein [Clostridium botulinum]APQ71059.1 PHP domain protein [Clostridium botulinum]AUN05849.1 phosphatase [Clostridium botulinum]EPS53479.1 PHP domain-containing protein [Clostridium botulinum Af84]
MIYADLHVHTNHSDGICEIANVLDMAKKKGIKAIAITDHDTVDQFDEINELGRKMDLEVVKGIEMSCYDYDVFKKVHIVGLWLNKNATHVKELCDKTLKCRDNYHRDLIKELSEKGYDITYEDAKKYSKYSIVFKMNIFQALKEKYKDEMTKERYNELFASKTSKETDLKMGYTPVMNGIEAIKKDGGIPIIAHPCQYDNYDEIEKYVEYGLQGIEINHSKMKKIDYKKTLNFAAKYNLAKSGGSDFHDPDLIEFGCYGLTKEQYEELKHFR